MWFKYFEKNFVLFIENNKHKQNGKNSNPPTTINIFLIQTK